MTELYGSAGFLVFGGRLGWIRQETLAKRRKHHSFLNPTTKTFNYTRDYIFERKSVNDPTAIPEIPKVTYNPKSKAETVRFHPMSTARSVPSAVTREPTMASMSPTVGRGVSVTVEAACDDVEDVAGDEMDGEDVIKDLDTVQPSREEILAVLPPKKSDRFTTWVGTTEETGKSLVDLDPPTHTITEDGRRIQPRRGAPTRTTEDAAVAIRADSQGDTGLLAVLSFEMDRLQSVPEGRNLKAHQFALTAQTTAALEIYTLLASDCPKSFRQVRNSPEWPKWEEAMKAELAKMEKYDVWELAVQTDDMRVLEARWVFTRRVDGNTGEAAECKARWVAKGYRQIEGIDYNEIFASVAHKDTSRVFLAAVNYHRLLCDQVDIKAAFLNGDLQEVIYLTPAEGSGTSPEYVYRLKESLYGLKQSPRCFNDKLDAWLKSDGFVQADADACLYSYRKGDVFLMLTIHVDDQLVAGNDREALDQFKRRLNNAFECTDHGAVNYFLGSMSRTGGC